MTELEDRYADVGGVRTRYWTAGENGTPLVLVHALGSSVDSWAKNLAALGARRRVLALDLIGFGLSDKPTVSYALYDLAEFLRRFLDAMKIPHAVLVGNSLGGAVSMRLALAHPDRVGGLVLVASAGLGRGVGWIPRMLTVPCLGRRFARPNRKGTRRFLESCFYDRSRLTPDLVERLYAYSKLPGAPGSLRATVCDQVSLAGQRSRVTGLLAPSLAAFPGPILTVVGREDRIIPASHAEIVRKHAPRARIVEMEGCGHLPMYERPEEFNRIVLDFLDEALPLQEGP